MIDALTGHNLWTERYDRDLKDIFALQDEITIKILTATQVKLTEGEQASGDERYFRGKQRLDCYLKYLEAQKYLQGYNIETTRVARRIAEEMMAICPEVPMSYVRMTHVHLREYWLGSGKSPQESIEKGIETAQKALAMDDSIAIAHALPSDFYCQKREYDKAISEGERAVALDPGGADIHRWYATTLVWAGRPETAIPILQKALRLDPFGDTSLYLMIGNALRNSGRFEEAVVAYRKSIKRSPDSLLAHINLAAAYSMMGREKEAHAEAAEAIKIDSKFSLDLWAKRQVYKDQSQVDKLVDALRKAGLK